MNRILLLGAGFSRNWNGRLATEMRAELQTILKANAPILSLLQNHDFETVVAMVQADFDRSPSGETTERLRLVQEAVNAVFKRMNEMFAKTATLEFGSDVAFMIQKWLARFDAIFTLNQDLLLELHYHSNDPGVFAGTRWHPHGWYMPGVREVRAPDAFLESDGVRSTWHPNGEHIVRPNAQPYFKLHGSSNWVTPGAEPLLIIGTDKPGRIRRHPLLEWYHREFRRYLSMPDTRLVVIGYSFSDDHINQMILEAAAGRQLKMFVVHPKGRSILVKQPTAMIPPPEPLRDDIPSLGESMRALSTTFKDDEMERDLLYRVFAK
ncbi:MAG: SIR2 family protein [Xanthobacteraceae bacterium]